jgi:hypothetical protein
LLLQSLDRDGFLALEGEQEESSPSSCDDSTTSIAESIMEMIRAARRGLLDADGHIVEENKAAGTGNTK